MENDDAYGVHGPPSTRYSERATPTGVMPPSLAASARGVAEVTYVPPTRFLGSPIARAVVGGVSSTRRTSDRAASTLPAMSSLDHSRKRSPSPVSRNGPVAA